MICNPSSGQLSNPINFSIFNASNNQLNQNLSVSITNQYNLGKALDEPCITGDQSGCYYTVVIYEAASVELPSSPEGYIIAYQRCCRINGINNIVNSGSVGNTFFTNIPGTNSGFQTNSSPAFLVNDTAVVCSDSYFQYSFQATDRDGDSLAYSFCDAYEGASQASPAPVTAANPPYNFVPYQAPFSGTQPMGSGVNINSSTGLISGIAPTASGEYVVCVCVREYRNGTLIGITRKELHIRVGDCDLATPVLNPRGVTCDGFTINFQNDDPSPSPLIQTYFWDFGVPSLADDTSILASPSYTYPDTGVYVVKLITNKYGQCSGIDSTIIRVYPGFFPGFIYAGACVTKPIQFTDTTRTNYGIIDTWSWNFGDSPTLADTSHLQNPLWTYSSPGPKTATLVVSNSKGCIDTAQAIVDVVDKPALSLAFRDTLICTPDNVTLNATGTGAFSWTPLINIVNANTASPTVSPVTNTWYYVNLDDNGCENDDSVLVRVTNGVNLTMRPDTTICLTDPVQLTATTNALNFQWTPAATIDNPNILNPIATPTAASTVYTLLARIGTSCVATGSVTINTVPYPMALAGPDQVLCYNTAGQLNGSHNGISFSWSPTTYLSDPTILNPIVTPPRTTTYVLTSFDNRGCPKPGRDSIVVTVNPRVRAFAGFDTIVVVGQPLQLQGSGGVTYQWTPSTGLSNPNIANPIGVYGNNVDSVKYKLVVRDAAGCPDSAYVTVRVFKVKPTVFVPTAFTPNGDGLNDVVRPIMVGIRKLNYFSIYNRWGEMVFTTTQNKKGWDGTLGGREQSTAVFVWMVSAEDYTGAPVFLKGTVTLIR
jgi:gliding motility-associated-like protein